MYRAGGLSVVMLSNTGRRVGTSGAVVGRGPAARLAADFDPRGLTPDELARALFPLAAAITRRTRRPGTDPDEVLAGVWWHLYRRARKWTPAARVPFVGYVTAYAQHVAFAEWERRLLFGGRATGRRVRVLPLARTAADVVADGAVPEPAVFDPDPAVRPFEAEAWRKRCRPRDWRALEMVTLGGLTNTDAAAALGTCRRQVRLRADRAARAIRGPAAGPAPAPPGRAGDGPARGGLTDAQWHRVRTAVPVARLWGAEAGARRFVDAVLWVAATGRPWASLPARLGAPTGCRLRFRRWHAVAAWPAVIAALDDPAAAARLQALVDKRTRTVARPTAVPA